MPNSQLPVSQASAINSAAGLTRYKVITQEGRRVTLENNPCSILFLGQPVVFDNDLKGIVVSVSETTAVVQLNKVYSPVGEALQFDWLRYNHPDASRILIDLTKLGSLEVYCVNSNTSKSGFIGWSLYNQSGKLLALGNDRLKHNVCSFKGKGYWSAGEYTLVVRSFQEFTFHPLGYATHTWSVTNPVDKLSAGSIDDYSDKLYLS